MAIDVHAVNSVTGKILFATRVEGKAADYDVGVGTRIGSGRTRVPVSLGVYNNSPMEKAIRVCIDNSIGYLCTKIPAQYYHYK